MNHEQQNSTMRPIDVVKSMYAASNSGDLNGMFATYSTEVVIEEATSLPFGGVYRGHEGLRTFVAAFSGSWEHFTNADLRLLDAGETVIGLSRLKARSKRGIDIEVPLAEFFRVRDGKIVELKPYYFDGDIIIRAIRS